MTSLPITYSDLICGAVIAASILLVLWLFDNADTDD